MITQSNAEDKHAGNNSGYTFDGNFRLIDNGHLVVTYYNTANEALQLAEGTHYEVIYKNEEKCTIRYPKQGTPIALLADGEFIELKLAVPEVQKSKYGGLGKLNLETLEKSFDLLTQIAQAHRRDINKSLQLVIDVTDLANTAQNNANLSASYASAALISKDETSQIKIDAEAAISAIQANTETFITNSKNDAINVINTTKSVAEANINQAITDAEAGLLALEASAITEADRSTTEANRAEAAANSIPTVSGALADMDTVGTAEILNDAVSENKLSGAVRAKLNADHTPANGSITGAKLATGAVTDNKIPNNTITLNKMKYVGDAGQVLMSNGLSNPPAMQDLPKGTVRDVLQTFAPAAYADNVTNILLSSINDTNLDNYDYLEVVVDSLNGPYQWTYLWPQTAGTNSTYVKSTNRRVKADGTLVTADSSGSSSSNRGQMNFQYASQWYLNAIPYRFTISRAQLGDYWNNNITVIDIQLPVQQYVNTNTDHRQTHTLYSANGGGSQNGQFRALDGLKLENINRWTHSGIKVIGVKI